MTRCLMLDVDGVVVNGRPEDGRSWASDIERDLGVSPERLQTVFFAPHWAEIVTGRKPLRETLEVCMPALSRSLNAQDFIDYWFERDSAVDAAVLADCDALRARGLRIFLATNQEPLRAAYLMERLDLGARVDGMISSADLGAAKPQRAFFEAALQRSGSAPQQTILVDDTVANVEAAIEAGWSARHWTRGGSLMALLESAAFC